jgi:hypothetical protein
MIDRAEVRQAGTVGSVPVKTRVTMILGIGQVTEECSHEFLQISSNVIPRIKQRLR